MTVELRERKWRGLLWIEKMNVECHQSATLEGCWMYFAVGFTMGKLLNLCMMHKFVHKTFETMWTIDILVFYSNGSDLER